MRLRGPPGGDRLMAYVARIISELVAGIRGAENGTATLTQHASATGVTWYSTYDMAAGGTGDITLDSRGAAEVYVSTVVDVTVKDEDGATVASFTSGYTADGIDVVTSALSGTDYGTGAVGTAKPVRLDVAMAAVKDPSFDINGTGPKTVSEYLAEMQECINVKAPEYGAVGNGLIDDTAAIQAAINDAQAEGLAVFFPAGTYKLSSALSVFGDLRLIGAGGGAGGAGKTILKSSASSGHTILDQETYSGSVVHVRDMTLYANHSGATWYNSSGASNTTLFMERCGLYSSAGTGSLMYFAPATSGTLRMTGCWVQADNESAIAVSVGSASRAHLIGCDIKVGGSSRTTPVVYGGGVVRLVGCYCDSSSCTSANFSFVSFGGTAFVESTTFSNPSSGTVSAMNVSGSLHEANCEFGSNVTAYQYTTDSTKTVELLSRQNRQYTASITAVSPTTVPLLNYGVVQYQTSITSAVHTLVLQAAPPGCFATILVKHTGTTGTVTVSIAGFGTNAIVSTANTGVHACRSFLSGNTQWWAVQDAGDVQVST